MNLANPLTMLPCALHDLLMLSVRRPLPRVGSRLLLSAWLLALAGGGEAQAQDEAPVCITAVGDKLVAIPGDCPDPLAPQTSRRTNPGLNSGSNSGSSSTTGNNKRSAPAQRSSEFSGERTSANPVYQSGPYNAPAPGAVAGVEKTLARLASLPDEQAALGEFESFVGQGSSVVPATSSIFLNRKTDTRVRWVAGRALGRIYSPRSVDSLITGLADPVPLIRIASVQGLTELGDRKALPALVSALNDPAAVVRAAAIDALASLGTREQVPLIVAQLYATRNFNRGRGIFVRPHAAQALGTLGGPEATQALIEVVNDADPETRQAAHAALLQLSGRSTAPSGAGSEQARWQRWWNEQRR